MGDIEILNKPLTGKNAEKYSPYLYEVVVQFVNDMDYDGIYYNNPTSFVESEYIRYIYDWRKDPTHEQNDFEVDIRQTDSGTVAGFRAWIDPAIVERGYNRYKERDGLISSLDMVEGCCKGREKIKSTTGESIYGGSHGLILIERPITNFDFIRSYTSGGLTDKVLEALHIGTHFVLVDRFVTTEHRYTTKAGLDIIVRDHSYKGKTDSEVIFRYNTESQKKAFFDYLKERGFKWVPKQETVYQWLIRSKTEIEKAHCIKAEAEVRETKKAVIDTYTSEIELLKKKQSHLIDVIKHSKDIAMARKYADRFVAGYYDTELREQRFVPIDFIERAKYLLNNAHRDIERVRYSETTNKRHKNEKMRYYGITRREYRQIVQDYSELNVIFNTTLSKHKPFYENKFKAGISLSEYAKMYLPDKKKKTAENLANRIYNLLAAEFERIHKEQTAHEKENALKQKIDKRIDQEDAMIIAAQHESYGDKSYYEALVLGYGTLQDEWDEEDFLEDEENAAITEGEIIIYDEVDGGDDETPQ